MKLKSALALVLSLSMTVTLFPVSAYAATTNKIGTVASVSEDSNIPATYIEYTVKSGSAWATSQTIDYEFTNAEFLKFPTQISANGALTDDGGNELITINYKDKDASDGGAVAAKITNLVKNDDDSLIFTFTTYEDTTCVNEASPSINDIITISIADGVLKTTGDAGASVTLELDPMDSDFTAGSYTIARIIQGGTTTTLKGSVKTYPEKVAFSAAELKITEKTMNSLDVGSVHVFRFTLPKKVEFTNGSGSFGLADISGSLFATTALTNSVSEGTEYKDMHAGEYFTEKNGRVMYAALEIGGSASTANTGYLKPYIKIDTDAKKGPVTLAIDDVYASSGGSFTNISGLKIATYGTEGVTISSPATPPTVVAGQVTTPENDFFWTKIVLTETLAGSLRQGRRIDVDLPEEAQIVTAKMNRNAGIRVTFDKTKDISYGEKAKLIDVQGITGNSEVSVIDSETAERIYMTADYDNGCTLADDTSGFSVTIPEPGMNASKKWDEATANTLIIYIPITVRADYTGDIKAEVSGRDFEATSVTIAKVVAPITLKTEVTDVVNGMQNQKLADITVEESVPGYIGKTATADKLKINVDNSGILNLFALDKAKVSVTEGDLGIKDTLTYDEDGNIIVTVTGSSIYKSTIKITGIIATTSRLVPQGTYEVGAVVDKTYEGCATQGSVVKTDELSLPTSDAVIENGQFDDGSFGVANELHFCSTPYMNLTTGADTNMGGTVAEFYLEAGKNSTFTVNGTSNAMDAAAYIDENNRTMVPIRYVAYALGLTESDISYDMRAATATISGLNNVVKVTTGSSLLVCSNSEDVQMDTAAVNYNSRLYVPARFIAQAMGAQVSWNQDNLTVTITQ